jgi:general secretion pathway protein E
VLWAAETTPALPALAEVTAAPARRDALRARGPRPRWPQRIAAAYAGGESSAAAVIGEVESGVDLSRMMQDLPAVEDLLEAADDAPIIRMLNALLTQAAKDGASDIHIEPYERSSSVRFRVDGTLREVVQPNKALHAALISRLKIMAELDIAEKRLPQDGRISCASAAAPSTCACPPCPGARRARGAAPAGQDRAESSRSKAWA